jgi:hypothetical protein
MKSSILWIAIGGTFGLLACGSGKDASKATATGASALVFKAPCAPTSCPDAPVSSDSDSYVCAQADQTCAWSPGGSGASGVGSSDGTASWRECAANECNGPEIAPACPNGFESRGLRCGSENEAACSLYAVCIPQKADGGSVTCGPNDCGPRPEIAAVCKDGTTRELECRARGAKCVFESPCE